MSVDRNEAIWTESNTGVRVHAFVQQSDTDPQALRAMCRTTIVRSKGARFVGKDETILICARCLKLAEAMWDRAEASMAPATEAHDFGYVAPVEERTAAMARRNQAFRDVVTPSTTEAERRMDALHAEATEMDRTVDEALGNQPSGRMTVVNPHLTAQPSRPLVTIPVAPLTPQNLAEVVTNKDGSVSGPFPILTALYQGGYVAADPMTGGLYWT